MILIFDIGKTNKKAFVFDAEYRIVYEKSTVLPETKDEDGFQCEDIDLLTHWFISEFNVVIRKPEFDIKSVNFSAYGASFVLIGEDFYPIAPLYNYLKPLDEKIQAQFYKKYGGEKHFAQQTASPVLGNLNSGMQLYRLKKEKRRLFNKIFCALHLPQYFYFLLMQEFFSDITSIGCHTNLWDFEKNDYHNWVLSEGIDEILSPIIGSDFTNEINIGEKKLKVGTGLHDSSAALIPYLIKFDAQPFILISTGTWCISLNPFNQTPLTSEELEQDCLCYISYKGKPVKAARYFGGNEHEQKVKNLTKKFGVLTDAYQSIKFDASLVETLNAGKSPSSFVEAYHALMMEIVKKQVSSTQLVLNNSPVEQIFVDGGFSKNDIYMRLLAQSFHDIKVFRAEISEATALGAALAISDQDLTDLKIPLIVNQVNL